MIRINLLKASAAVHKPGPAIPQRILVTAVIIVGVGIVTGGVVWLAMSGGRKASPQAQGTRVAAAAPQHRQVPSQQPKPQAQPQPKPQGLPQPKPPEPPSPAAKPPAPQSMPEPVKQPPAPVKVEPAKPQPPTSIPEPVKPPEPPPRKAEPARPPQPARTPPPQVASVLPAPNTGMVEEVVRDIGEERDKLTRSGRLELPYDQFSFGERVNYECLFAKNACELLMRVVPEEIGLRSLEISEFRTVYAVGLSSSKDLVNELFVSLKREKVDVLPPPLSFIRPNGDGGYRFAFTCDAGWGLHINDPYVDLSLSHLPLRENLDQVLGSFGNVARKSRFVMEGSGVRLSADVSNGYRRYEYRYKGTTAFADFVKFLRGLYDARVPCAFKSLELTAKGRSKVGVDAVVVYTTKD